MSQNFGYQRPFARAGQVIGLFGGSFDPAHEGHVHVSREAIKRLGLDGIWWLVTPGNPLKSRQPNTLETRIARAQSLVSHPKVTVTGIEARLNTRYTADTIEALQRLYPGVTFVWLMGADSMAGFHRWDRWEDIAKSVPMAVFARPGGRMSARLSPAAMRFRSGRIRSRFARTLSKRNPVCWTVLNIPMRSESSTAIRAKGNWTHG